MQKMEYRTFIGFVDAEISGAGFCIAGSNEKYTIVPDVLYLRKSSETLVEAESDTTGVIITRDYEIIAPMDGVFNKKIVCYVKTGALNTVAANTSDTYRVNISVLVNGDEIARESGAAHSPNSTTEVTFNDIIVLDTRLRDIRRGDIITIRV